MHYTKAHCHANRNRAADAGRGSSRWVEDLLGSGLSYSTSIILYMTLKSSNEERMLTS